MMIPININRTVTVDFSLTDPTVVNVLTFLDPSWPYSGKHACKLRQLSNNLRRLGLPDTAFFVIFKHCSEINPDVSKILKSIIPDNFTIVEDNEELEIWKKLKATRKQVLVINRCGKLKHKCIVGWGIPKPEHIRPAIFKADESPCDCYKQCVDISDIDEYSEVNRLR